MIKKIDLDGIPHKKIKGSAPENIENSNEEQEIKSGKGIQPLVLNTNQIFKYISPELHEKCKKECLLSGGLENFEIFLFFIKSRIQKLVKEKKIFRNSNLMALNPGIVGTNGSDPYYLVVRSNPTLPNGIELNFVNRFERPGRNLVREMDNNELEGPEFPTSIFNPSLEIVPEYHHILVERQERLPDEFFTTLKALVPLEELNSLSEEALMRKYNGYLLRQLKGSIAILEDKLKNGVVKPIPFWYAKDDSICWYAPIEMGLDDSPSVALVLNEGELNGKRVYRGHTLISLQDAFKCARVIGNVNSDWCR
ncbi:MAG: DUF3825 domain-containing protein [Muribaculaceae bacterium]|nr:DUF3825 domain-containing protein [Muribaculaceae bacterium]